MNLRIVTSGAHKEMCDLCAPGILSCIILRFQIKYEPLNLNRLQYLIDSGRIDASKPINMHTLYWSGAIGKIEHGVKLLADVSPHCILRLCVWVNL